NDLRHPTAKEEELFAEKIRELNPHIVGVSVLSPYVSIAKRLTQIVKNSSSAIVVWGGIHPTLSPETSIEAADMICLGEGEGPLTDLVQLFKDGKDYQHIENLWSKHNGHIARNSMRPLNQDLDSIPFPAYARDSFFFIGSNQIVQNDPTIREPILAIMPARGCPFGCTYCVNSLLRPMYKSMGHFNRRRSVPNVIAELKDILSIPGNRKKIVEFHDENFGTDESWLSEFETRYPKEIGLPFKVQYNPTLVKSSTIGRLVKCGLHRAKFGIEAGTDRIRNEVFKRPGKNRQIIKLAHEIAKYDVKIRYDLIMDIPYDTEETLKETIGFLLQLPRPLHFNLYSLQYFPDYPLTQRALADGHISEQEAKLETLEQRLSRTWGFAPRLFPFTKKQMLQNIIWLITFRHTPDGIVKDAVMSDSWDAKIKFIYLNLKSVFWGKIREIKRMMNRKIA
ncbi:MAG: cobalamin-dependent protein, partial [Deltaproteobacteria bacterium]